MRQDGSSSRLSSLAGGPGLRASSSPGFAPSTGPICCNGGCQRPVARPVCCSRCPEGHTRTCCGRQAGPREAEGSPRTASASPAAVACAVCLEEAVERRLPCGHTVCASCLATMEEYDHRNCPLCRRPLPRRDLPPEAAPSVRPAGPTLPQTALEHHDLLPGYVLLRAPPHLSHLLGWRPTSWATLENRLGLVSRKIARTRDRPAQGG